MRNHFLKRAFDLLAATVLIVFFFPIMIEVGLLIRLLLGPPALFRQERPGLHGQPFTLYKFRTMKGILNDGGDFLPDEMRLTSFGHVLRSLSLDELPTLINVIKGEMSLIGPRPLLMQYLNRYTPQQMRRHEVLPGLTGWAQVNGRNALSWKEKFALDMWYIDNRSLKLDFVILILTIWKIIKREGIAEPGQATAREYGGNLD